MSNLKFSKKDKVRLKKISALIKEIYKKEDDFLLKFKTGNGRNLH